MTPPKPHDRQAMGEETHEKVLAIPQDFTIDCPDCGDQMQVEFAEQKDAGFECDPENRFIECKGCNKLIEVTGRWRNLP